MILPNNEVDFSVFASFFGIKRGNFYLDYPNS